MTVKELKEILDGCNNDATVIVVSWDLGKRNIRDEQIFHALDGKEVTIDLDHNTDIRKDGK